MIRIANAPTEERRVLFANTAQKLGIHPAIIEKDFWVCFMLDHIFNKSEFSKIFVFKGGTSLSKAYHAIERFSEDIDLILDWRILKYGQNEPYEERSKTQQDKFNKQMNSVAAEFYRNELVPKLRLEIGDYLKIDFKIDVDSNDEMVVNFYYPAIFTEGYIRSEIRLEIGPIAQWTPSKNISVKPFVADVYGDVLKIDDISILTVEAYRTFWEKATILHKVANMPEDKKLPMRYARHYYDLYCLSKTSYMTEAFEHKDMLEKDVAFKEKFYYTKSAGYATATLKDIKLVPNEYRTKEVELDYGKMKNMIYGNIPSFEEIIETIKEIEDKIHKI